MTGQELISWIIDHHGENCQIYVQYRDSGGLYPGAGPIDPFICKAVEEDVNGDIFQWSDATAKEENNAIIL